MTQSGLLLLLLPILSVAGGGQKLVAVKIRYMDYAFDGMPTLVREIPCHRKA